MLMMFQFRGEGENGADLFFFFYTLYLDEGKSSLTQTCLNT